jgi:hypothetical protein
LTATDIFDEQTSKDFVFEVKATLPEVMTNNAENITDISAELNGQITSNGGVEITEAGFCYNTTGSPTIDDNYIVGVLADDNFSATISGLQSETVYFVRSFATNSVGLQYGNEISFTTTATFTETIDNSEIVLYPNPIENKLFISSTEQIKSIKITDATGRILIQKNVHQQNNVVLDLSKLNTGIYFIEINTENKMIEKKLIKR